MRLLSGLGGGGVIYLTAVVFHNAGFSATAVGQGLAAAALAGTAGRLLCGWWLDRGRSCNGPIVLAALISVLADARLYSATSFPAYVSGQMLIGLALGLWWPAIELAVTQSCAPLPSSRAFALVRTADALGIATGVLLGSGLAALGRLRGIFLVDIACMVVLLSLLLRRPLPPAPVRSADIRLDSWQGWVRPLLPLLAMTVLSTGMVALLQGALPLDLVRGGLARPPLPESTGALLLALQLGLLLALQWPLGRWLSERSVAFGLGLSLLGFALGSSLLAFSSLGWHSLTVLLLAQLPLAAAVAAFLPTATEAVVEITPPAHQGMAMALFSQCFALSAFLAPQVAGLFLDQQRHGGGLWLAMAALCLLGLTLVRPLARVHPHASPSSVI
ncbi:MFS transporter [Synechococcus sp. L2F]|uniref:MFS transporter n=1 Tax=Synechococcus sp. L2F TaxID=2823739 RepID=UPI0020CE0846|nr:MFS transporter [Synechococcus sp. L2F]MCP9827598.1 MFS transporter [Synechococcus sp. L2F]